MRSGSDREGDGERQRSAPAPEPVVDMRGPQARVVRSVAEALDELPTERAAHGPLPELRHNVRLLAEMSEAAVQSAERKAKGERDAARAWERERERLERSLDALEGQAARLEEVSQLVARACDKAAEMPLSALARTFGALRSKYRAEWRLFRLGPLALALVSPIMSRRLAAWSPMSQPSANVEEFKLWRDVLAPERKAADGYESLEDEANDGEPWEGEDEAVYLQLVHDTFLPRVRQAIVGQGWSPKNFSPVVTLLTAWHDVVPQQIVDNITAQLVAPKIRGEVESWDPRSDPVPLHSWLLPWRAVIVDELLAPVWSVVRQKLTAAMSAWHPSDLSARAVLQPWRGVFDDAHMDAMLDRCVVPKLSIALREGLVVNPADQKLDVWRWVVAWEGVLSETALVALLEADFFPKWAKALSSWLADQPDWAEVSAWYKGWKSLLSPALQANDRVRLHLNYALDLLNAAVTGEAPPPPPASREQMLRAQAKQALEQKRRADVEEQMRRARGDATLRDVVEQLAAENDVLFAPTDKTHEGKRVHKFGGVNVVVDASLVKAQLDGPSGPWRPVGLVELVEAAHAADQATRAPDPN
eukprot:m51a1_g9245 putative tuftelin-interacting protein 11 (588) ;mRNA; f:30-1793